MQKGRIEKRHGAWHLRYRAEGKQVTRRLAPFNDKYRTERSVRPLADEILEPLNAGRQVNGPMTLQQYTETVFFPSIKPPKKKPSTYKGYFNLYSKQIQPRIGGLRLSTCTTADMQRILYRIDEEEELSHQSFLNINSVLSAIFTHARRSGTLTGPNPTDGVEIPEGKRTGKTHKYTLEEVEKMTAALDGVARCAVVVAAWTGLSLAELRGLKWEDVDFENSRLNVVRTVWHKEVIDTKTEHRAATVHLLPNVVTELSKHRKANPDTTWVFEGPRVFPLDLATLGSKRIKKALEGTGVEWHGLHAFRRGLATRLLNNKTDLPTVGRILRHTPGSIVTLKHYAEVEEGMQADALRNLPTKSRKK
ncbi:MAG TPA: site-specific integrase [Candidatus Udaeobacter sp.]|nr:site-specific integrase [Candidatus Udaeobacter sp.]